MTQTHTEMLKLARYAACNDVAATKRDAAIRPRRLTVAGAALRDIAVESGISHMSVKRIIERQEE